jgi:hypothetical protein
MSRWANHIVCVSWQFQIERSHEGSGPQFAFNKRVAANANTLIAFLVI